LKADVVNAMPLKQHGHIGYIFKEIDFTGLKIKGRGRK